LKKIYFAGYIRGGRNDSELYQKLISCLQNYGEVLTEHVGLSDLSSFGESGMTDEQIYQRDLDWLKDSEIIVAEVTTPSLGVGFEIAKAIDLNKKVLCIYRTQHDRKLSAMINGCNDILVKEYLSFDDAKRIIDDFMLNETK
jgi:nucleoside 2-deoxyribosyltransferase